MKYFLILLIITYAFSSLFSQNCGQVLDFRSTAVDLGNGMSNYSFEVDIAATSGGSKSVELTISCPNNAFVTMDCQESYATVTTVFYGPFIVPTCTEPISLDWMGHTNSTCGGNSCAENSIVLPVELSFFRATVRDEQVDLTWRTASEVNNAGFELQRLNDSNEWKPIAWLNGYNNSSTEKEYRYTDKKPLIGNNYYRLKQYDQDGHFNYSDLVGAVFLVENTTVQVFPNPVTDLLFFKGNKENIGHLKIVDGAGRTVREMVLTWQPIDLSSLDKGVYFISIYTDNNSYVERILKE